MKITSRPFQLLVSLLKETRKTCTVVEQSCGGVIQASIMAQPGASAVFFGGTVAYNTRKAKPLLLNDDILHQSLTQNNPSTCSTAESYIQSKMEWTAKTSVAFCKAMDTDYAIAEGGAVGPTFSHDDMKTGFAVVAVAGKGKDGKVSLLSQEIIRSHTANRQDNMRFFADEAATLATRTIMGETSSSGETINRVETEPEPARALILERATHLRTDAEALGELEGSANFIILQGNQVLVKSNPTSTGRQLAFLDQKQLSSLGDTHQKTFLGLLGGKTPVFGVDLLLEDKGSGISVPTNTEFVVTRSTAPLLDGLENELALHATAYAEWQRRSSYCNMCGGPTVLIDGGTCRRCTQCSAATWPRQDPSMICAVSSRDGERILLAHSMHHAPRFNTVLAGFVEAGETLEAAVAREAYEETGIRIDEGSVKYVGSQPWPFPQSCMFGFTATADDTNELTVDTNELVSARWFSKDDVVRAAAIEGPTMQKAFAQSVLENDPDLPLLIPPKGVIARRLIDKWLAGDM
jgi:NAD+ diphosphatase